MNAKKLKKALIFNFALALVALLFSTTAIGAPLSLNIDAIFSGYSETLDGASEATTGTSFRSNTTFFLGTTKLYYGAMVQYEIPSENDFEYILGGAIGFGDQYFLELGGGLLKREIGGFEDTGYGIIGKIGTKFQIGRFNLRISLPIVYKAITDGQSLKTIIQYIPYLGLGYNF
ncbi:MAG: hypothetical protein ISR65_11545 [Bacteriovoracaceae bacterium]|nr:hypothetical protein [Bacteriovoracaceae bacterium]